MALPLIISMVVAAVSAIFPPKGPYGNPNTSSSCPGGGGGRGTVSLGGSQIFFSGVVVGVGISYILGYELSQRRWHDRIRLVVIEWLCLVFDDNNDHKRPTAPATGTTFPLLPPSTSPALESDQRENGDSNSNEASREQQPATAVRHIISTRTSLTSSLWVSTIRLPPQHELQRQMASGMEFFHVLQGKGEWGLLVLIMGTDKEKGCIQPITSGDAFVVDANRTRWIVNTSATEDLTLLRSSDAGRPSKGYDQIGPTTSTTSNGVTGRVSVLLNSSLQEMGDYFSSFSFFDGSSTRSKANP